jgi:DNA repair protein RadC
VKGKMQQTSFIERSENTFWKDLTSGKFAKMVKEESRGQYLKSSTEAYYVLKPIFAEVNDVERMYCIFMDTKNNILSIDKVATGSLTSSSIYPRELIKLALKHKAGSVVISHNHPSGDSHPSKEDKLMTLKLTFAFKAIDVSLLDHIVVGDSYFSFADEGIMKDINTKFNNYLTMQ